MKKGFLYSLVFFGVFTIFSCENTDYKIYDSNDKDKLFFVDDTLRFTYGLTLDKEVDLNVGVKLIGFVDLKEDKAFKLKIVEDTNVRKGEHYDIPDVNLMPKDSLKAFIPLDFKKANLKKNKEYRLTLQLVENENYAPADVKECVIFFSNKDIEAPVWWQAAKVGEYNQEKFILFVDFYHQSKELSPVIYENIRKEWGENLDEGTSKNLLAIYSYQGFLNRYILTPMYEYYLESNDPLYRIPNPNN